MVAAIFVCLAGTGLKAAGETYETATVGTDVTLAVTADGNPSPTFQWLKNGAALPGATGNSLVLRSVTANDNAVYNAIATNSLGWALSNDLILTVQATANIAPVFTLQPVANTTAATGGALTLSVAASGSPAPTFQWRKNGVAIASATNATLVFPWLTTNDTGVYTVVATNIAGQVTSNSSVLTVIAPPPVNVAPVITIQPQSYAAAKKSTVTFTVAATGTPAPTFQWRKNGVAISGATSATYTIKNVNPSQDGTYSVVVQNIAGSVTSSPATLRVR